jgi:hypothetical protein
MSKQRYEEIRKLKAGDTGIGYGGKSTSQTSSQPMSLSFKAKKELADCLH